jgi:hypothetical protein
MRTPIEFELPGFNGPSYSAQVREQKSSREAAKPLSEHLLHKSFFCQGNRI